MIILFSEIRKLVPVQDEFIKGKVDKAELKEPFILLNPLEKGHKVNFIPCSPLSPELKESGMVRQVTLSPGLFERFTLGASQKTGN
jgi:hypothetical protein